jgi:uncharacterized membrane protein
MKRAKEDNTVGIIQRTIKHFRIHVIKSSVKEALKSHPDYPTFKSICDTLNEWQIENYPLRYGIDEIMDIEAPYIVHFNSSGGQIGFVTSIENNFITCYTSYKEKRQFGKKEFQESCSGAVILLNPDENSGEKDFRTKWENETISEAVIPLTLSTILLLSIYSIANYFLSGEVIIDKVILALFFSKIAGIILSVLLILHEFELHLSFTDKLCHLNKSTNCNTVLHDKVSKVFGWLGWADIGFIYFTGGLIFLLKDLGGAGLPMMAILAALAIPYPLFSIYYQGFVLRKWCPMCLGVQIILIAEFILLLPQFSIFNFSLNYFVTLALTFLVVTIVYTLFILFRREKISDEMYFNKYLGFKKNPDILKMLLMNQPYFDIPISENSLIFGNNRASLQVTVFLSLHCSHCARSFEKIRAMLKDKEDVLINIVLMAFENMALTTLYNYHRLGKDEESLNLLEQWLNEDPYSRTGETKGLCIPEDRDISKKLNQVNRRLFEECNVLGTPTFFINGFRLPHQYDIDDIRYFREIFEEKEETLNKVNTVN